MFRAFWHGYEIYDIEYRAGWCEILFRNAASPITGTGRCRVLMEDIELRKVE